MSCPPLLLFPVNGNWLPWLSIVLAFLEKHINRWCLFQLSSRTLLPWTQRWSSCTKYPPSFFPRPPQLGKVHCSRQVERANRQSLPDVLESHHPLCSFFTSHQLIEVSFFLNGCQDWSDPRLPFKMAPCMEIRSEKRLRTFVWLKVFKHVVSLPLHHQKVSSL